jgi:uncharacterized protein YgbK (DUF1537 family)
MPRLGWYGDDFTGATDTLANLAEAGMRSLLFLRVPTPEQLRRAGDLDAVGIAGAARAMAPDAMAVELAPVGRFFKALGVEVMHYKCCSTFDSAPEIGSIGEAVRTLHPFFPNPLVPIIGGQPNIGRYCVFGHLYAAAGIGGTVTRIDRHPTMSVHPVTPMVESDLCRHLAKQGLPDITSLHYPLYAEGVSAIEEALAGIKSSAVLFDVASADELRLIGDVITSHAKQEPLLAIGASSVAQAVASVWGRPTSPAAPIAAADGPVFVMVGSLSPVSRAQADAATSYVQFEIDGGDLVEDTARSRQVREEATALLQAGKSVIVRTSPPAMRHDTALAAAVACATASFVATILEATKLGRLCVAGGDTSSQAALQLPFWGLGYRSKLAPGVTLCTAHSDIAALDGLDVVFKGGQMGPPDLFERLVHGRSA